LPRPRGQEILAPGGSWGEIHKGSNSYQLQIQVLVSLQIGGILSLGLDLLLASRSMDKRPSTPQTTPMSAEPQPDPASATAAGPDVALAEAKGADPKAEDHASMRLALDGDERGFADLVSRYERRAWRVARNMVPSDEDAHDLVQEAFMRVFRSLDRFDFSHAFSTWLYRIVTNLAIDLLRKRRPTFSTSGADEDEPGPELVDERMDDPSDGLVREETVSEVQDCLNSLAPHFQSALVLRELEGMPCNDIAEVVGATHVTVRWRLHRGRKLFQEEWERRERDRELRASANNDDQTTVQPTSADEGLEAKSPSKTAQPKGDTSPGSKKQGPKE
jgi:RNA polymerase sigma-70 factor, ECF subfamily